MLKDKIILASGSPRRKELLGLLGIKFKVVSPNVHERFDKKLSPSEIVKTLAERKAESVAKKNPDSLVIGADTLVFKDDKILGKPKSKKEAIPLKQYPLS